MIGSRMYELVITAMGLIVIILTVTAVFGKIVAIQPLQCAQSFTVATRCWPLEVCYTNTALIGRMTSNKLSLIIGRHNKFAFVSKIR